MADRRPRSRWIRGLTFSLIAVGAFVAWTLLLWSNFGAVQPGKLYRSAQLGGGELAAKIRGHRIKTVLNLRGSHPESAWYRDERAATLEAGATQVDMPFSSCEWMSKAQARALLQVLETADRPILVHCFHGSERTAMVSAFALLLQPDSTLADAEAQFTARHLYFGLGDGVVTRQHLERYEDWLRGQSLAHNPDHLRDWLRSGYEPGQPCRDQWDHDPYPLVVVSKGIKKVADRR